MLILFCFLVEVPGCEPYREYLFISLRQQPIWQQPRFWNAIFHDSMQAEREHRLSSQLRRQQRKQAKQQQRQAEAEATVTLEAVAAAPETTPSRKHGADSPSSSSHQIAPPAATANRKSSKCSLGQPQSAKEQEDIAFRQLRCVVVLICKLSGNAYEDRGPVSYHLLLLIFLELILRFSLSVPLHVTCTSWAPLRMCAWTF